MGDRRGVMESAGSPLLEQEGVKGSYESFVTPPNLPFPEATGASSEPPMNAPPGTPQAMHVIPYLSNIRCWTLLGAPHLVEEEKLIMKIPGR